MQINQLNHLVKVIETGSFTEAALELHIAQPSLSSSIKKLENEIGFTLIDRTGRKLMLTPLGEEFYTHALKLVNHHNLVENFAKSLRDHGANHISVGVIESVKIWFPEIVEQYNKMHSDMQMKVTHVMSEHGIRRFFNEYKISIAVTNQLVEDKNINSIPLYDESLMLALPIDSPLNKQKNIYLKDIKDCPLIISHDGYQTRTEILKNFNNLGITPYIAYEIERFDLAARFITKGLGVAILPEKYANTLDPSNIAVRKIDDLTFKRTMFLAFDNTRFMPEASRDFINLILNYFDKPLLNE